VKKVLIGKLRKFTDLKKDAARHLKRTGKGKGMDVDEEDEEMVDA
jgi:hypothetical protein